MPTPGECCSCKRGPAQRFRFNLIIEDRVNRRTHTQLLCVACLVVLLRTITGQSVERTPQCDLDDLQGLATSGGW